MKIVLFAIAGLFVGATIGAIQHTISKFERPLICVSTTQYTGICTRDPHEAEYLYSQIESIHQDKKDICM